MNSILSSIYSRKISELYNTKKIDAQSFNRLTSILIYRKIVNFWASWKTFRFVRKHDDEHKYRDEFQMFLIFQLTEPNCSTRLVDDGVYFFSGHGKLGKTQTWTTVNARLMEFRRGCAPRVNLQRQGNFLFLLSVKGMGVHVTTFSNRLKTWSLLGKPIVFWGLSFLSALFVQ